MSELMGHVALVLLVVVLAFGIWYSTKGEEDDRSVDDAGSDVGGGRV